MRLFVKFLDNKCDQYYVKRNYDTDSGFDLYCIKETVVQPWEVETIESGIACRLFMRPYEDTTYDPSGYYLYPRSSISKTPLVFANSVGIIDHGYTGQIMAKVRNLSNKPYVVSEGTSLFQLCSPNLKPFQEIVFVDELEKTERGDGGFGSTNVQN